LRLAVALGVLGLATPAHASPVAAHAMVHTCCTPPAEKERVFREAAALDASYIRVDVELTGDLSRLDEIVRLSRRYELPVLGILIVPPDFTDAAEFGRLTGRAVERAGGAIPAWEVMNEPDADYAFHGTPEQYARMLSAAYEAIKARAPDAQVSIGGLVDPRRIDWLARVLDTPGADARHRFDIASLHLRGPVDLVVNRYREFSAWLAARGFHGPVWVTEHGYPADPNFQVDPAYTGGAEAQAAYLTQSLVGLGEAGAPEIFVTLRDNPALLPANVTEGVVGRPAFEAVRRVANEWDQLLAWRAEQRESPCRSGGDRGRARVVGAGAGRGRESAAGGPAVERAGAPPVRRPARSAPRVLRRQRGGTALAHRARTPAPGARARARRHREGARPANRLAPGRRQLGLRGPRASAAGAARGCARRARDPGAASAPARAARKVRART
jgi:hypothetical protein